MNKWFETHSPEETHHLGERIGRLLKAGDIVLLFGDLGAGKTTLTQGIARGMGVGEDEYVRSPSFTLVNQYRGRIPAFHIDLYRIESPGELDDLGLEDALGREGVAIVEWAEKLFVEKQPHSLIQGIGGWIEIRLQITEKGSHTFDLSTHNMAPQSHSIFALH